MKRERDEGVDSHGSRRTDQAREGLVISRVLDTPRPENDVKGNLITVTDRVVGGQRCADPRHVAGEAREVLLTVFAELRFDLVIADVQGASVPAHS